MSTLPSQQYLHQIYTLLSNATSTTSSTNHPEIYSQLSNLQQLPQFYMGLITIASTDTAEPKIRQMALLTLKSALKRNQDILQFTNQQYQYLRNWVIKGNYQGMDILINPRRLLVSVLALWGKKIDYEILKYLLLCISQDGQNCILGLQTLKILFEDIKYETQNLNCFHTHEFIQFLQAFFQQFSVKITSSNTDLIQKLLKCTNLLLKYTIQLPNSAQTLHQYLNSYLLPLLNNPTIHPNLIQISLQGIQQIIQIKSQTLTASSIQTIIAYTPNPDIKHKKQDEIIKKWLNVILDIVDKYNEQQDKLKLFLKSIVDKTIKYLVFTKEDQINVKMQMQEESNPYQYQEGQDSQEEFNHQNRGFLFYTKRKLSVFIFQELFSWYSDEIWPLCQPYLQNLLQSQNFVQRQAAILLTGIIYSSIQDHLQFLQIAITIIRSQINLANLPDILRSTSLWALGKMAYLIVRQQVLTKQIMSQLITCAKNSTGQVHDAAYSTLDDFIRNSEEQPANFNDLFIIIVNGIRNCTGKPLNSVLKICVTLYQKYALHIPQQISEAMIKQLCAKWAINSQIESVMSPVLECLVTISSSKTQIFKKYAFQIFKQAFVILESEHQKNLILRSIDLLSSIVSTNNNEINSILAQNQQLHSKINNLLQTEQNQIRNFTYGFLGDICKICSFPKFAQIHTQTIGNTYSAKNLTSCSNALTCLADLIIAHPFLRSKYGKNVMQIAVQKLKINNLQFSYGFNFARIFGRLGNICPKEGSEFIEEILQILSGFLKCHQHQKLTDQTFKGIFQMIENNPQAATKSFQHLVDSFMIYPCQDKQLQDRFVILLKSFKSSLNQSQWIEFLNKPVFLPALAKRIDAISN